MPIPPVDAELVALRRQERMAVAARDAAEVAARVAQAALAEAQRRNIPRELFTAQRRMGDARGALTAAAQRVAMVQRQIGEWQRMHPRVDLDAPMPTLPAAAPVLLLPVRIETRYTADRAGLRVRIFPDQIHTDAHEAPLTDDELAGGRFYWQARWDAAQDAEAEVAESAFGVLAERFRPRRAAWIVLATRPGNSGVRPRLGEPAFPTPPSRASSWSRATMAALLPTDWTVTGYVADAKGQLAQLFQKKTRNVADPLHVGPDPQSAWTPQVDADGVATELPLDDGMSWTVRFDRAEEVGMALTVANADFAASFRQAGRTLANTTIERLVVHGVRSELAPDVAARQLEALLVAHRYSDGLAILKPGTPTNNAGADAGYDSGDAALAAAMAPDRMPIPSGPRDALVTALGVDPVAAHLDRVEGGDFEDAATTGRMVSALWAATLGYTLDQFFGGEVSDPEIEQVRDFAVANLRPGGPLPAMRIGRQPYGLLPVMAPRGYTATEPAEAGIADLVATLLPYWTAAATSAPTLARPGHTLAENMQELLQQRPAAAANSFRRVLGPGAQANSNIAPDKAQQQELRRAMLFEQLGITHPVRFGPLYVEPTYRRLGAPFVQAKIADPLARLSPDYLATIVVEATITGARDRLLKHGAGPTLLEGLLSASLVNEYDAAAWRALWHHRLIADLPVDAQLPANLTLRAPEFISIEPQVADAVPRTGPAPVAAATSGVVQGMIFPSITGTATLADTLIKTVTGAPTLVDALAVRYLKAALEDVRALAKRPAAELDRSLRGVLDAYSHRLDAWITALATARLRFWRGKPESKGTSIGGFAWVERLRPDTRPDSDGYIHAPSIHHAQTAALLRSGHLAHRDEAGDALAIDLSSRRVRLALGLLEGVAAGQPLGALLGYRFERMLRDRSASLARFILPIRRLFPLNPPPGETTLGQAEAIAARDVVDGVKLIERWRLRGAWLAGANPPVLGNDLTAVEDVAAAIDDMFDAVKDLLLAEGVHQLVGGNPERAAAALAGMDRQSRPVDPEVARTPRNGRAFLQRAGLLLVDEAPPPGWATPQGGRALGEPRLNGWIGRMIGDPARFRFGGSMVGADGAIRPLAPVSLADLALDPLSVLLLAQRGGGGRESELQERIAARFADQAEAAELAGGAILHLLPDGAAGTPGLAVLEALLDRLRPIAAKHRAMTANDLAPPGIEAPHRLRPDVLAVRADAVQTGLDAARKTLDEMMLDDPGADLLAAALDVLSRAGLPGATPTGGSVAALRAQAEEAVRRARRAVTQSSETAAALPADASEQVRTEAQVARLRALLGPDFPVLPPFELAADEPLLLSLAEGPALTAGRPAVLHGWLTQMAAVKPRLAELADALAASEFAGGPIADLRVGQLPHTAGARWIGLPLAEGPSAQVDLSLVLHAPGLDLSAPPAIVAGLISDSWTEVIPGRTETTAISFNYDAPGARPPQTMLLAVHPDPAAAAWRPSEILASVNAAADLAHIRAVRPQDLTMLGEVLPLIYLPENFDTYRPGLNLSAMAATALAQVPAHLSNVLGKG